MSEIRDMALERRIKELEEKIEQLLFSRRVLMNLVERVERERMEAVTQLERLNKKLQAVNAKYARKLWHKNRRIIELETKLYKKNLNNVL
ncbi:translation initiation factor 2 [Thermincola ferriacetica]